MNWGLASAKPWSKYKCSFSYSLCYLVSSNILSSGHMEVAGLSNERERIGEITAGSGSLLPGEDPQTGTVGPGSRPALPSHALVLRLASRDESVSLILVV